MAWIALTSADAKNRLSGPEYSGVTAAALASGQTAAGIVDAEIADVVKLVRGYVAACAKNTLGAGDTIPDELKDAALAILRARILTRLPGLKALFDEARKAEQESAIRLLEQVAACKFTIEQPATATTQVLATPQIAVVTAPPRQTSREKLKGL